MSEADRPTPAADDAPDRTFNEEQQPLFESDDTPDKTRRRTPGAQSGPPAAQAADAGEGTPGAGDAG